jgi:hypothetical protein
VGIECLASAQHTPRNAGEFVGESGGQLISMHARCGIGEPVAEAELLPVLRPHQQDIGRLYKQSSQVSAAALGNAPQYRASARAELFRNQTESGAKVTSAIEGFTCAYSGNDGCRNQRPDTGDAHQAFAVGFILTDLFDLVGYGLDTFIEPEPVLVKADN